jgi:RimJ/RimL family protein N-acetyltransferase
LKYRSLSIEDVWWITEIHNDPEAAKFINDYPHTEHEIREALRKDVEGGREKHIVAELDGDPAGCVSVGASSGRSRHVAWLGIEVRKKYWGMGIGSSLMKRAIKLAKDMGCRKLMLGVTEGNERALRLYKKFGFEIEAYEEENEYIDGSWRSEYIMGLELAPCGPKMNQSLLPQVSHNMTLSETRSANVTVRNLSDRDLNELHRLQNCPDSTKSAKRIPPVTKEETKRWYQEINSKEGIYCLACFDGQKLLGYLRFRACRPPSPSLKFEEIIVDVNSMPAEAAKALIEEVKNFNQRYNYHSIFAYIPETSSLIVKVLETQGFQKTGAMKAYYFIDGYYVDVALYRYSDIR